MADEASKRSGPFDLASVQALAALMSAHDLSELELKEGGRRLLIRRGHAPVIASAGVAAAPAVVSSAPAPSSPAASGTSGSATAKNESAAPAKKLIEIKSQTVGTFYSKPNPDAPAFVRVGSRVTPTTVVGLIEAMKIFNEITADCTGVVAEILVEAQQPVEFGQILFRVDPAG